MKTIGIGLIITSILFYVTTVYLLYTERYGGLFDSKLKNKSTCDHVNKNISILSSSKLCGYMDEHGVCRKGKVRSGVCEDDANRVHPIYFLVLGLAASVMGVATYVSKR